MRWVWAIPALTTVTLTVFLRQTISFDDSWQVSVMSYIDQTENIFNPGDYAHVVTPMIADIAAIHDLYGAPDGVNSGNTRYGYKPNTGTYMDEYFKLWSGEGNPFFSIDFTNIYQPFFYTENGEVKAMIALSWDRKDLLLYENEGTPAAPNFVFDSTVEFSSRIEDYEFVDMTNDGDPGACYLNFRQPVHYSFYLYLRGGCDRDTW